MFRPGREGGREGQREGGRKEREAGREGGRREGGGEGREGGERRCPWVIWSGAMSIALRHGPPPQHSRHQWADQEPWVWRPLLPAPEGIDSEPKGVTGMWVTYWVRAELPK